MEHNFCPYCMSAVEEGKPCGACGLTQGSYTPSPHHLPPGTVLKDRYLVGRVLGEGGFGITYIGCDLQLELKVAIKEYFPTDKASRVSQASLEVNSYTGAAGVHYDKGLKKFLQEARTIARMDKQPVIVNVRDFFEINHTAYIVMEYVEGTTFKELVEQRGGRIPAGELLYLMEPLFYALKEMHGNGLIHRDISPENLMIEKGEIRLLDFGCARESADGGNTLTIALKHGYAPVEQYQSKGQGPWTDVYALSATIYYCLTGRKPPQAMDRLVEDELIPPRKLGVELTQRQENALLYGLGVAPKRRYQSMEEFHTALYEGFVPGAAAVEEDGVKEEPAVTADAPDTDSPDAAEQTVETPPGAEKKAPFDPMAWLKQNKLLAGGIAAALALVILLAVVLPRVLGPSGADNSGPLAQVMETVEWLRQDDVEIDGSELRAKLDALPIDKLFADAVHVTTDEQLINALEHEQAIVIDADIDFSFGDSNRNNRAPVLISEGVTVTASWCDNDFYENVEPGRAAWTVDGSILINRGTLRGSVSMGDWDNDSVKDTNLLVNYGTMYGILGAYDDNSYNTVVNLGTLGVPQSQFRQTSFYNLGTILHGTIAPEGETPLTLIKPGEDYYIDLFGSYFYNGGDIVMEGQSSEMMGRLDVATGTRFVNAGSIRLGYNGEVRNHAFLLNFGEIAVTERTAGIHNSGWLLNAGADCALDMARCSNTGLVQAGQETSVDLSRVNCDGGAVLPFSWDMDGLYRVHTKEEFYDALKDQDCAWVMLDDGMALTLTEDLTLTSGLAIPDGSSLTMDGCSLTVAGRDGYLAADGPVDLRGGVLTVQDDGVASVSELRDCGGVTIRNNGYLMLGGGLQRPNDGAAIELSSNGHLTSIGPLELHGAQVLVKEYGSALRGTGGVALYACTVDVGENGNFLTDGCGSNLDPDTVITNHGWVDLIGWDPQELACRFTNYGELNTDAQMSISGSLVNHGHFRIWASEDSLLRVSGSLENHGTVEFMGGGRFQPWVAGTVTGVPEEYVAR